MIEALSNRRQALAWLAGAAALTTFRPAAAARLDNDLLARAADRAASLDQLRSLVVARNGEIVLGEAFRGPALADPVNVKSVSKTIVATLVGIAIDKGMLPGADTPLRTAAPGLLPRDAPAGAGEITVGQLLSMQSGLERTSGPNYGRWVASDNWVRFVLSRPFVAEPGGPMLYSTGNYHVLGAILAERTGRSLRDLARDWLGDPLDFDVPPWTRDPQGRFMGGNNMRMSALALLRFGEMARTRGMWAGQRIVGRDWLEASWRPRARSPWSGHDYGYGWFLARARGHWLAYARGYGGQIVYVVPTLDMTVVITSDPNRPARSGGYIDDLHGLLADTLIPAAERT